MAQTNENKNINVGVNPQQTAPLAEVQQVAKTKEERVQFAKEVEMIKIGPRDFRRSDKITAAERKQREDYIKSIKEKR